MTLNEGQHHLNQYHSAEFSGVYDEPSLKEIDLQLPTRKPKSKLYFSGCFLISPKQGALVG